MLHIEHINLVVHDIPETLTFYQAAFPHWKVRAKGTAEWHGVARNWLHFGDDYQYLTFNDDGIEENRDLTGHQVGLAHFAFVTPNLSAMKSRLAEAGFAVHKQGAENPYRANLYFLDPNGFEVEFVEYSSDLPEQRNSSDE
ncbi:MULTISPECIES: VOC family protein [unclassified Colwellia]|uniref:VOC family protein n=1 Tax=unclassified Colwellia TaxID=196834 RepID=UPI0015F5659A|nr:MULTISPECIES: VOC family protein [unclassified Colwellia]MBA6231162.1 VOC family protein [Colwellia sp. MB02u-7]MBA6235069.1 VOC family protein [Colwellia sp. MB02u-11]MBA6257547.1 VOC family protein [Colwellia sp. MB3u-28]MBA6260619.1 VOC family protein [Colwellia sp. MB3u-41]MBA6301722.1 VOC family protein [Colwellia sp. MB3u-22]